MQGKSGFWLRTAAAIALFSASLTANAALLFEQNPLLTPAPVASGPSTAPPNGNALDDFSLSGSSTVEEIVFWTYEDLGFGLVSDAFDLAIYGSMAGTPDLNNLLWSSSVSVAGNTVTKDAVAGAAPGLFSHSVTLGPGLSLGAGQYFLQVASSALNFIAPNIAVPTGWQASATTSGVPPFGTAPGPAGPILFPGDPSTDMAFRINGSANQQPVPAPATLLLMAPVLLVGLRRVLKN